MGWVCILAFPQLWNNLSAAQFGWLLAGGIIYTIGGVIYALKLSIFNDRHPCFGSHEIFHLFVMGDGPATSSSCSCSSEHRARHSAVLFFHSLRISEKSGRGLPSAR